MPTPKTWQDKVRYYGDILFVCIGIALVLGSLAGCQSQPKPKCPVCGLMEQGK